MTAVDTPIREICRAGDARRVANSPPGSVMPGGPCRPGSEDPPLDAGAATPQAGTSLRPLPRRGAVGIRHPLQVPGHQRTVAAGLADKGSFMTCRPPTQTVSERATSDIRPARTGSLPSGQRTGTGRDILPGRRSNLQWRPRLHRIQTRCRAMYCTTSQAGAWRVFPEKPLKTAGPVMVRSQDASRRPDTARLTRSWELSDPPAPGGCVRQCVQFVDHVFG